MAKKKNKEQELEMLRLMMRIRRFEERASQAYQMQKIGGFCHLYIGQEAVAVGSQFAIREDDMMMTAYRDHGHAIARGTSSDSCMAELLGKTTGCSRGMGGSMHFFDKERHFYGGHAIVGGHIPLAAGLAFAAKYKETDQVTLCYLGDGAINIGAFHEGMNLAQLWKLPVCYIVENNMFGMGTAVSRACSTKELVDRAKGYDMKQKVIDGMNVREVRDSLSEIAEDMRKTHEPWFVEARTYRYRGHSMSDPGTYRTKQELDRYKKDDPITRFRDVLYEDKLLTEEEYKAMDDEAKKEALQSLKNAEKAADPPLEERFDYTFVDSHS
jgi:pyruvate dehydrogenase E1 component alpha subunit